MGLLDGLMGQDTNIPQFLSSPVGQGLLGGVFGLMANARRGAPINSIGRGALGGLMAYGGAQDREAKLAEEAQQRQLRTMQMSQMQTSLADQELARKTASQYFRPGAPAVAPLDGALPAEFQTGAVPMPAKPSSFDMTGYANARMAQNPLEGLKLMAELQKETPINKLDVKDFTPASVQKFAQTKNYSDLVRMDKLHFGDNGGALIGLDQFTGRQVSSSPKTGNPSTDLILADGQGGFRPNSPLIGAKKEIAQAGAARTNVSVNTDKSYFGNVAEGLAKNDVAIIDAARSAPDRIASAQRIRDTLRKNPITGTGAETRLAVNKAFATAGLIDPAQANATEALVTELASQTLDSVKSSGLGTGQGFTDKDRAFLQDARSGRIEMTPANIERIANLNEQAARASIKRGNSVISKLRMSPEAGKMGQQLDMIEEPAAPKAAPPTVVRRGMYQGKKVEQMSDGTTRYAN